LSEPPILKVHVTAPAAEGKANEAVLAAVSVALRVSRRSVRIVSGATGRTKVLEVETAEPEALAALAAALVN